MTNTPAESSATEAISDAIRFEDVVSGRFDAERNKPEAVPPEGVLPPAGGVSQAPQSAEAGGYGFLVLKWATHS